MDKLNRKETNRTKATKLRREHSQWRDINFIKKKGFFPVFHDFKDHLKHLSGGAVSLFIYLGLHSNNQTGECYHSINKISEYFGKSPRTISSWIDELDNYGLIERIQLEMNSTAHTFIRPYTKEEDKGESILETIDIEKMDLF